MIKAFIVAVVLLAAAPAMAQTVLLIDINKGVLSWTWTKGTTPGQSGDVEFFEMGCGSSSKNYTKTTTITNPAARSVPVLQAIGGSGVWFCAVVAGNKYGKSGPSNEVNFDAGDAPSAASGLVISTVP